MKREENVECMTEVQSSNTLVRSLTSMSGQVATPEQIDLLGFWEVGHEKFENHIKFICNERSICCSSKEEGQTPCVCLIQEIEKKKIKQLDKEKIAFAWNTKFGSVGQQYIKLPRVISDPNGNLHKGQKSYTT